MRPACFAVTLSRLVVTPPSLLLVTLALGLTLGSGCARGGAVRDDPAFQGTDGPVPDDLASAAEDAGTELDNARDPGAETAPADPQETPAGSGQDALASETDMGELEVPGDGEAPVDSAPAGRPGFYAARLVYQQLQTISGQVLGIPAGGTILNTNTIYALVDIDAEGNYVQRTCGVEIRSQDADGSSGLFESDITPSPNIFPNIAPHTRKILWTEQGWELPMSGFPVGWEASDEAEAIPTSDSDARVRDTDQDGNPGITIVLSGNLFASGELYAVQRMRNRVVGRFDGDNLVGENFDQSEQEVLGGTIIDTQQTVADAGDSETNRADLVLRPPDTLTCTQLLADPGAVFPAHPVY